MTILDDDKVVEMVDWYMEHEKEMDQKIKREYIENILQYAASTGYTNGIDRVMENMKGTNE